MTFGTQAAAGPAAVVRGACAAPVLGGAATRSLQAVARHAERAVLAVVAARHSSPPGADMALGRSTDPVGMPCATQVQWEAAMNLGQPRGVCDCQHSGGKSTNNGSSTRRRRRRISTGLLRGCSHLCRMHRRTTCSTGRADKRRAQQRLLPHTVRRPRLLSLHRQICSRCAMLLSLGKRL